jgi:uncharacterized protein (TIGR02444 family)
VTAESLWPFALEFYARPGVEAALLELQDAHGHSPPYLIWRLWLASRGVGADTAALASAADLTRAWEQAAVWPLRRMRRRLNAPGPGSPHRREQLRARVQALELEAERMLLQMLEERGPSAAVTGDVGVVACLREAAWAWGGPAPDALLEQLAAAL